MVYQVVDTQFFKTWIHQYDAKWTYGQDMESREIGSWSVLFVSSPSCPSSSGHLVSEKFVNDMLLIESFTFYSRCMPNKWLPCVFRPLRKGNCVWSWLMYSDCRRLQAADSKDIVQANLQGMAWLEDISKILKKSRSMVGKQKKFDLPSTSHQINIPGMRPCGRQSHFESVCQPLLPIPSPWDLLLPTPTCTLLQSFCISESPSDLSFRESSR